VLEAREGGAVYEVRCDHEEAAIGTTVTLTFSVTATNSIARLFMTLVGRKMLEATGRSIAEDLRQLAGGL
jgi:hypothetical protein